MSEYLLAATVLGGWTFISIICFVVAYRSPSKINPYILDNIPSVFPTLGIMCTAIGITYGLSDFDPNNIQGSLPELIKGLKSAFIATILGIAGLIISQKILAVVQAHIDNMPDRPRQASDELTALNQLNERIEKFEKSLRGDIQRVAVAVVEGSQGQVSQFTELQRLVSIQTGKVEEYQRTNVNYSDKLLLNGAKLIEQGAELQTLQNIHTTAQKNGLTALGQQMDANNNLLTNKFDEFSELLRQSNTEALVEVMRKSTEQFNAQMNELIDKLVKENFKELNNSVQMLNTWQKENKEQIATLTGQVRTVLEQVDSITVNLNDSTSEMKTSTELLTKAAKLNHELVDDDGKLMQLISELDKVMISDGKFTDIVNKVDTSIETLTGTVDALYETSKKVNNSATTLNAWQQENKNQVAELTKQVKTVLEQVNLITVDIQASTSALGASAKLNKELIDSDGKLIQLIKELEEVMISDGKFTSIVSKVEGSIDTMAKTTDAFEGTTQKLNVWVRNQMNFSDKAEILVKELEEFRNLNGSVWDKYRAEMEKAVNIVSKTSTTLKSDLEDINQEFYDRLNDTLQNLDELIQRFMSGQTTNRR